MIGIRAWYFVIFSSNIQMLYENIPKKPKKFQQAYKKIKIVINLTVFYSLRYIRYLTAICFLSEQNTLI